MSAEVVKQVIERAIDDESFRRQLFSNPDDALRGYNLSDGERGRLHNLDEESFDDFAGPLTGRTTKGQWIPTP
ncbi:MAG: Os1348 family NHLP clan protein [Chloroflexi bacterium]|nr:Os1348 family NHLP clan protein [Chloroflexota bacterium]MCI0577722.1 Os1348 family NHLP clan protein [Chloroflexota bacterium]MCI0643320.1 Os1348 family NHLP clan protein [Chloroflexota bacterium]MCI0730223.1 Os1348 family NHLP clan protein [Chloroflexota bacterium]